MCPGDINKDGQHWYECCHLVLVTLFGVIVAQEQFTNPDLGVIKIIFGFISEQLSCPTLYTMLWTCAKKNYFIHCVLWVLISNLFFISCCFIFHWGFSFSYLTCILCLIIMLMEIKSDHENLSVWHPESFLISEHRLATHKE